MREICLSRTVTIHLYLWTIIQLLFVLQSGKAIPSDNENANNRAAECIAERIEVFKSAFGETEEQLNEEKYVVD